MKASKLIPALLVLLSWAVAVAQPTIKTQPADASVSLDATAQFTVWATSTSPPITYQWWFKDAALDPVANPSAAWSRLSLTNVTLANAGPYFVVVSDTVGSVTSRVATLTVDPTFIKITGQPIVTDIERSVAAAWCDYDGDGFTDVLVANEGPNTLYHNQRDGTFLRVTNALTSASYTIWGRGWGDFDNDGKPDLFAIAAQGSAVELYRNDGGGQFSLVPSANLSVASLIDGAWVDLDGDGWLDVVACTWEMGKDVACRNLRDGRFQKLTTNEVGALVADAATTSSPSFADFDNDGDPDAYVSCETAPAFLFRNQGIGRYEKVQLGSLPGAGQTVEGNWGDFNNDGFFDLFTTARDGHCVLHANVEGREFVDVTATAGLGEAVGTIWGPAWGDFDNDGDLDLFLPGYSSANRLYMNNGDGTFTLKDVGSPMRDGTTDACAAWVDYDNDGFLDLFWVAGEGGAAPNFLYRNNLSATGNGNHWLKIQLNGAVANRSGIGAKIRVRAVVNGRETWQLRQIASNGAFASGTELIAHFGLGDATNVDLVRIEWPSGNVQELTDVQADQVLKVIESVGITPMRPSASLNGAVTLARPVVTGAAYQWRHDGVDLAGQTNRTLVLTNITAEMAGRYSVVTTTETAVTTNFVYVLVDTQFTRVTEGAIVTNKGTTCGVQWGDYDDDGFPDLFVCNEGPQEPFLYRNNRDGTFREATPDDVGELLTRKMNSGYAVWLDYDNDGRLDLFQGNASAKSRLFHNEGNGRLAEVTADLGFGYTAWGVSVVDFDNDGWLDLGLAGGEVLLHNEGGVRFARVPKGPGAGGSELWSWADFNNDGFMDLYVGAHGNSPLYLNQGGVLKRSQGAIPPSGEWMGAWGDYNNDGFMDLYAQMLFANDRQGKLVLVSKGPIGGEMSAWADYDNDGYLDLSVTYGSMGADKHRLYRNRGDGTFAPVQTGSLVTELGAWAVQGWCDYDNDGSLDCFIGTRAGGGVDALFHNNGNGNHWLIVRPRGTKSNTPGIGATVRLTATIGGKRMEQMRQILGGIADDLRAHFGLANATRVTTLTIEWPSGAVQEFTGVAADQVLTIWEPPFVTAAVQPDGACVLNIRAEPNRPWQIQASSDLLNWQTLATVTPTTIDFEYGDTAAGDMICRFYRLRGE